MRSYIAVQAIRNCAKCQSSEVFCEQSLDDTPKHYVACNQCGHEGNTAQNYNQAVTEWNYPSDKKSIRSYKEY